MKLENAENYHVAELTEVEKKETTGGFWALFTAICALVSAIAFLIDGLQSKSESSSACNGCYLT
jgi:hypothetical protein